MARTQFFSTCPREGLVVSLLRKENSYIFIRLQTAIHLAASEEEKALEERERDNEK